MRNGSDCIACGAVWAMTPNPRLGDQGLEIDMHANVPYHALKALAAIAPVNEIRHYLKGVYVEARKDYTILVVTNGHYLVAHKHALTKGDADQAEFECILPVEFLRSLKVSKRDLKFRDVCLLSVEDIPEKAKEMPNAKRATLNLPNGFSMSTETIDGKFPDWRRIVPGTFSKETAQINPEYVADVYRAIAGCYNNEKCIAPLLHNGDKAAAIIYADTVAVLMPLRAAGEDRMMPDWALPAGWEYQPSNVHKIAA